MALVARWVSHAARSWRAPQNWNVRDTALTLLLHGTGIRVSQAFHLWVDDVVEDPHRPGHALVRIFHPTDGLAPPLACPLTGKLLQLKRREYLQRVYELSPRTEMIGTSWSGWKEPAVDDQNNAAYLPLFWYPQDWSKLFFTIWKIYILEFRSRASRHPFAWVNTDKRYQGLIYTRSSFYDGRKLACERAEIPYSKIAGTTAHGHRHAMGDRLSHSDVDKMVIQRVMHHKSIFSQAPYTQPDINRVNSVLESASRIMKDGPAELINNFTSGFIDDFSDVDPEGVFK
jgi:hypothetical protein